MTQKQLIIPFLTVLILNATAQDALLTGNRIIGGGFSISQSDNTNEHPINYYYQNEEANLSSYSFSPYYGRLYEDYTMVGIRFNVGSSNNEYQNQDENSVRTTENLFRNYGIGGFLRKYFPSSEKFGAFIQSGVDLKYARTENIWTYDSFDNSFPDRWSTQKTKTITGSIDAEAGLYFFVLPALSIETNLARFALSYSDRDISSILNEDGELIEGEGDSVNLSFNIINQFSFDKIFTLNYYF